MGGGGHGFPPRFNDQGFGTQKFKRPNPYGGYVFELPSGVEKMGQNISFPPFRDLGGGQTVDPSPNHLTPHLESLRAWEIETHISGAPSAPPPGREAAKNFNLPLSFTWIYNRFWPRSGRFFQFTRLIYV